MCSCSQAPQPQASAQEPSPPQQTLQSVLEANGGRAMLDSLLLLVHAVMLDTGFVGASEVCAPLSNVTMCQACLPCPCALLTS